MKEEHRQWFSNSIGKNFDMLVFGESGFPIIIFPTSKGSYFQYRDFGLIECVKRYVENGQVQIYTPDSYDATSWYNNEIHPFEKVQNHVAYEQLILNEVIFPTIQETGFSKVGVSGCSFGGFHAANIAFRHPAHIGYMFSLGGAFNIKQFIGNYYDDNCYYNSPPDYLPNLRDEWYLNKFREMNIILGTGETDICRNDNAQLSAILDTLNVPHWLDDRQGFGHDWHWWKIMFEQYVSQICERQ